MGCFSSPREHLPRRARRSVFSCCRARRILFIALLSSLDHRTTPGTSDPRNVSWLPSTDLIQTIVDQTDADRLAFVAVIANVAAHFDWGVDPLPGTHPPAFWWHYFSSVSALHDPRTGVLPTCWTAATKAKVAGQPGSVNRFNAYRNFLAAVKGSSCSSYFNTRIAWRCQAHACIGCSAAMPRVQYVHPVPSGSQRSMFLILEDLTHVYFADSEDVKLGWTGFDPHYAVDDTDDSEEDSDGEKKAKRKKKREKKLRASTALAVPHVKTTIPSAGADRPDALGAASSSKARYCTSCGMPMRGHKRSACGKNATSGPSGRDVSAAPLLRVSVSPIRCPPAASFPSLSAST